MTPLTIHLQKTDLDHVKRILNESYCGTLDGMAKIDSVLNFFRGRVFVEEASGAGFRGRPQLERERILSELIWRITCYLDKSSTAVIGVTSYELGHRFRANQLEREDGTEIFVLVEG